jgi:hypothetical protein
MPVRGKGFSQIWGALILGVVVAPALAGLSQQEDDEAARYVEAAPQYLKEIVPEPLRKWVLGTALVLLKSSARAIARTTRPPPGGLYLAQCSVLERTLYGLADTMPPDRFPMSLRQARALTPWYLSRLGETRPRPGWALPTAGIIGPDPNSTKIPILEKQHFFSATGSVRGEGLTRPGMVAIVPIALSRQKDSAFVRGVSIACVVQDSAKTKYDPDDYVPASLNHIYWRSDRPVVEPRPAILRVFPLVVQDAVWAYTQVKPGEVPLRLNDLEAPMGKANKRFWTAELRRLVEEYYLSHLRGFVTEAKKDAS